MKTPLFISLSTIALAMLVWLYARLSPSQWVTKLGLALVMGGALGNLALSIAGNGISADLVMARALSVVGSAGTGQTDIAGLTVGGVPVFPTGAPNQTLSLGSLTIVLNEQIPLAGGIIVNALHIRTFDGLTDVVIGSAKAGITPF